MEENPKNKLIKKTPFGCPPISPSMPWRSDCFPVSVRTEKKKSEDGFCRSCGSPSEKSKKAKKQIQKTKKQKQKTKQKSKNPTLLRGC